MRPPPPPSWLLCALQENSRSQKYWSGKLAELRRIDKTKPGFADGLRVQVATSLCPQTRQGFNRIFKYQKSLYFDEKEYLNMVFFCVIEWCKTFLFEIPESFLDEVQFEYMRTSVIDEFSKDEVVDFFWKMLEKTMAQEKRESRERKKAAEGRKELVRETAWKGARDAARRKSLA